MSDVKESKRVWSEIERRIDNATNTGQAKKYISDAEVFGDPDAWTLLCKFSSAKYGVMKSTKVMEIAGSGCVVQATTKENGQIAEALTFVPGATIESFPGGQAAKDRSQDENIGHWFAVLEELSKAWDTMPPDARRSWIKRNVL